MQGDVHRRRRDRRQGSGAHGAQPARWTESPNRAPMRQNPPVVADLDGDGQVEIISGGDVFTLRRRTVDARVAGVATRRGRPLLRAASVSRRRPRWRRHAPRWCCRPNGTRAGPQRRCFLVYDARRYVDALVHGAHLGPRCSTIADVDGDGVPEIVFAARGIVYAYHADGSPLWASVIPDDDGTLIPGDDPPACLLATTVDASLRRGLVAAGVRPRPRRLGRGDRQRHLPPGDHRWPHRHREVAACTTTACPTTSMPLVVDADGDGHAEIMQRRRQSRQLRRVPSQQHHPIRRRASRLGARAAACSTR